MRRSDRIKRKRPVVPVKKSARASTTEHLSPSKRAGGGWYDREYKKFLFIPFFFLVLALVSLGMHMATHDGAFINKGVSLEGGVFITVPGQADLESTLLALRAQFPQADIQGRSLEESGTQIAITLTADIVDAAGVDDFVSSLTAYTHVLREDLSIETIGSSLGATFFQQTLKALFMAFLFMGFVVFIYFGNGVKIKVFAGALTILGGAFMFSGIGVLNIIALLIGFFLLIGYTRHSVPSVAVMLCAFSNLVITLAIVNLAGIKLSTAGIAAFLMLIGYSVDTDILLSTRVIKRKGGTVYERVMSAVRTGLAMNFTTMAAVGIALIFSKSDVITQIMTILLIGLVVDMMNTWLQNVGILRWYLERKGENQ